ncbi:hypothetical protein [Chryseobacterium sp. PET-29]|uniref:hypothetical protein n=1 Tax=Chryseobacterium sp. PET-29 TaxID=2983267 RepID=UPI0021E6021E|nr:hypothetical protein [Chryseobacterium sp. PET-29]
MDDKDNIGKSLKDWLTDFYDDTGKISELIRNAAFAGIGIIWIFKNSDSSKKMLPLELICPLTFLVIALFFDIVQYIWRALNIYFYYKKYESKYDKNQIRNKDLDDVKLPNYIEYGTWIFFILKIFFVLFAYLKIYFFLIEKI